MVINNNNLLRKTKILYSLLKNEELPSRREKLLAELKTLEELKPKVVKESK